jgi:hypothetical protein
VGDDWITQQERHIMTVMLERPTPIETLDGPPDFEAPSAED